MKKAKLLKRLSWILQDSSLLVILKISGRLSWRTNQKLGAWLGAAAYYLARQGRHTILDNLKACFPDWHPDKRRQLARANFREIGKLYFELGYLWQADPDRLIDLIKQVDRPESVRKIEQSGGGVYVLLHQGCWELCGMPLSDRKNCCTLYKPNLHLPKTDRLINEGRSRAWDASVLPANKDSIRQLMRALKNGGKLFILGDIVPDLASGAVTAPFFGIPARTGTLISKLAQRAPVVFAQALRLEDGYRVSYFEAPPALYDKDPLVSATALNQMFEQLIRSKPEQYLWTYKRFRRGEAAAKIYR